jgi:hypothetical protein
MPFPSVDGTHYQVRIKYTLEGQQCFNVLSFLSHGSLDLVDDLLTPILSCITTHLLPVLSGDLAVNGLDVKNIDGATAVETELAAVAAEGALSTGALPSASAAVIALRTTHPGRTGKGRLFLPGIDEESADGSTLDATFIAAAVAFLACMLTAFKAGDPPAANQFYWMVHSRKDNAFYPVDSAVPRTTLSYLRSRKFGT